MKYVIEIEDEPLWRQSALYGENVLFKAKNFNALVFDKEGLDKLTPLDKELEEAYQKGFEVGQHEATTLEYQRGLDEAWEAITKIAKMPDGERMTHFGEVWISNILNAYSLEQIFTILKKSEFEPDEIKVWDEVKSLETGCTYIIHETDEKYVRGYNFKIRYTCYGEKNKFKKTGRHFPQVAELLKAMNGEQRNCSTCWYDDGNGVPQCTGCYSPKGYNKWKPKEGEE